MPKQFDGKKYLWKPDIDYRRHPELYHIGKGEQGVLICEPYKSEILPHWRFKTPAIAQESAQAIYAMFLAYLDQDDFVGADLARKFLQMGYTRARRYANYRGGRKYDGETAAQLAFGTGERAKIESAAIFKIFWTQAKQEPRYQALKAHWPNN